MKPTVPSNVIPYISWMALHNLSSSCSAVLSTNSMLSSIINTPSYGSIITTTYIGKDILGQLGCLFYSYNTGKQANKTPLKYITNGALLQQASYYLENASIFISNSNLVLPFLGLTSILKNISFISIGAVNATNLQKISTSKENLSIGELYSKVASINTLSSTLGMILGIGIIHLIPSYTFRSLIILPGLTFINLYSIRKATKITL